MWKRLLLALLNACANATPGSEAVQFEYSLSRASIMRGEPVLLSIVAKRPDSPVGYGVVFDLSPMTITSRHLNMNVELYDSSMKPIGSHRSLAVCPFTQWQCLSLHLDVPLHLFFSTDVPEGKYFVKLTSLCTFVSDREPTAHPYDLSSPPLALEVHQGSSDALRQIYADLLKKGLEEDKVFRAKGWFGRDWDDYSTSTRLVMWAYGPAAVSSQIDDMYNNEQRCFRYLPGFCFHACQNILEFATVNDVKRLVAIAESPAFLEAKQPYPFGNANNLLWLFQELKKRGDPQILPLIEGTLVRFPEVINLHLLEIPVK
jgi:hypothetical protein